MNLKKFLINFRNSQNNDKNIRNSIEEEFTQKPFTNEIKNRKNNLRKTQITFSQLQIKTKLDENHEKLDINSNENYETEDPFQMDEIKKEISFQKDLKKFVRTNISSNVI